MNIASHVHLFFIRSCNDNYLKINCFFNNNKFSKKQTKLSTTKLRVQKQKKKSVWLYVPATTSLPTCPHHTRRMTCRHPSLGPHPRVEIPLATTFPSNHACRTIAGLRNEDQRSRSNRSVPTARAARRAARILHYIPTQPRLSRFVGD